MQPRRSPGRVDRALAALILILLPLCAFLMGCQNANLLTPQQKAAISQNIQTGLVKTVTGLGVLAGLTGLDQPVYIYSPEMPGAAPFQAPGATVHLEGSFSGMGHGVQPGIEITRKHEGRESTSIVSVTSQGQWSADVDLAQGLNVFVARAVLGNKKGPDSNEVAVQADNAPVPSAPQPAPSAGQSSALPALMELLQGLAGSGHTILFITHSMELAARHARRIVLLDAGRILRDATARQVLHDSQALDRAGLHAPPLVELAARLGLQACHVEELAACLG